MHGSQVIVSRDGLNYRIMFLIFLLYRAGEVRKRILANCSAFRASVARQSKHNVLLGCSESTWLASVIICSGHDIPMNFLDQMAVNRPIRRNAWNPPISFHCGARLSL